MNFNRKVREWSPYSLNEYMRSMKITLLILLLALSGLNAKTHSQTINLILERSSLISVLKKSRPNPIIVLSTTDQTSRVSI